MKLDQKSKVKRKTSEMVFPTAHSSERRFGGEVVCSPEKHVARVDVGIALHSGSASRELVLGHFDHFLTFRRAAVKKGTWKALRRDITPLGGRKDDKPSRVLLILSLSLCLVS